ncbi:5507_t:CDS:2, partial [Paraglomus occultum]
GYKRGFAFLIDYYKDGALYNQVYLYGNTIGAAMEDFKKLPQNLQTQNNFDRLVELEQQKLGLEKLRLEQ